MGKGNAGFHSSRAEFLTDDTLNENLKYSRNGGCFVTTKKAIAFVVFAIVSLLIVVLCMYYYGPDRMLQKFQNETVDIEKLINETVNIKVSEEEFRLPTSVYPLHYRLWIHPILDEDSDDNFTFTGRVKILINCTHQTNKIVLNWDDLNITESDISLSTTQLISLERNERATAEENPPELDAFPTTENANETTENPVIVAMDAATKPPILITSKVLPLTIQDLVKDEENFKLIINLKNQLEPLQTYTLDMKFSGNILNNLVGLYKTNYVDLAGNVRWLATTHFQTVYARRVFPCFDEPGFKAVFEISVARRTNMTVLSNMPLRETEPMNETLNWVWDHFMKTPLMSTYIVAFTICDFENIHNTPTSIGGPVYRVWAPKDDLPKAQYALNAVQDILPFLENYFGIKYPLPKLDLVAIPNFGKEAMENWGLISFRKSALLYDPKSTSIKTKSFIFTKIANELAHQWFGNLVTMEWWSDLWLNEGFGTFLAEIVLTNLKPTWHAYSSIQLRDTYKTLYFDGLKSTHSIQTTIKSTSQIEQIFDTLVYQKGCSVLRMLNNTLSRKVFQKGLQDYLINYSYKSTTQDDLWKFFTKTARNESKIPANVTIKQLMTSWTTQSGYPILTVDNVQDTNNSVISINQTKMSEDNSPSDVLWYVPVTYLTSNSSDVDIVWLESERSFNLNVSSDIVDGNSWILLNIDETGFFRVNYNKQNWRLLKRQLRNDMTKIPVSSRGQLIDDAFQLANIGLINYTIAFDLVNYLNIKENNYIPWYSALRNLEELRIIIRNYEYSGIYDNFLLKLVKPMFDLLGTKDRQFDTQNEKLLRLHIVTLACKLRYRPCIEWARFEFSEWMKVENPDSLNPIPVDYRHISQCYGIKSGGPIEWEFLWNRTLSPSIAPIDLQTAYLSLGCTYDPWLINRYLEYSLVGNITLENVPYVWQSINHPVGVKIGFQFLRLNWDRIFGTYEDIYLVFSTIFYDFVSHLSTEIDLEDLTTFYKLHQNDLKSVNTILQGTVDQMKVRINWRLRHLDSVVEWLKTERKNH